MPIYNKKVRGIRNLQWNCAVVLTFFAAAFAITPRVAWSSDPQCYVVPIAACPIEVPPKEEPTAEAPPSPAECKPATASATVNPQNFAAALAELGAGETIVLAPGTYAAINLSGNNFGGATIQCAEPGKCEFGNSILSNVSGLTVDGIKIIGGETGLNMNNIRNITLRCSTMGRQTQTSVLAVKGHNLIFYRNIIFSSGLGCDLFKPSQCGFQPNGSILADLDYGLRLHFVSGTVKILNNVFTGPIREGIPQGLFNHSISLKEKVENTVIIGNIFDYCGRNCIEPGQQESNVHDGDISSGIVTITDNKFNNVPKTARVLLVKNIHNVVFEHNIFNNVSGKRVFLYSFKKGTRGYTPLTNSEFIQGIPRDRTVLGNGD